MKNIEGIHRPVFVVYKIHLSLNATQVSIQQYRFLFLYKILEQLEDSQCHC
jgi:hypothetical protein